jgi:hypothetical protein
MDSAGWYVSFDTTRHNESVTWMMLMGSSCDEFPIHGSASLSRDRDARYPIEGRLNWSSVPELWDLANVERYR